MKKMSSLLSSFAVMFMLVTATSISGASAQTSNSVKICTGKTDGNYDFVGKTLQSQLRSDVAIEVVNTQGSWENLQKLSSGECDIAITQSDAIYLWNKEQSALSYYLIDNLYTEYVHQLCNRKSTVKEFANLNGNTKVFSGGAGSGADVTVRGLITADNEFGNKSYTKVPLVNETDQDVSLAKVKGRNAECLFYVGSKGNSFMGKTAEKLAADVVLVPIVDKDFNDVTMTDIDGNVTSVWNPIHMPYDTYNKIMPSGFTGRQDLDTIGVNALMIVSENFVNANPKAYAKLTFAIDDVMNIVRQAKGVALEE